MYDELDPQDYRFTKGAQAILSQVEKLIGKQPITYRLINQMMDAKGIEIPRGWNLADILSSSKKVQRIPGYIDTFVKGETRIGLPVPDAFQVSGTSRKEADWS